MKDKKLRIGIPNGSLVDPKRGGLQELLDRARIYIKNIGANAPAEVTNIPWLEAAAGRPQELPALAASGYCDVFFCGDDWAREWELRGKGSEKMLGLGIGKVEIVYAEKESSESTNAASEYPYLARWYLSQKYAVPEAGIPIVKIGESIPEGSSLAVIESVGATEAKVYYGLAGAVVEASQSGETLKNYGLTVRDTVMSSECSLYCREGLDEWQRKKAERIAMMLEGAVNAQGKDLVILNVKNDDLDKVLDYIRENQLFAGEETIIQGKTMSEITLELPTRDCDKPLIDVLGDLNDLGATAIEGMPLSYSVK